MKLLFTTTLIIPQGLVCQFKVYKAGSLLWEFNNENIECTILLYHVQSFGYFGGLLNPVGNATQHNNLICQAAFELEEFYRNRHSAVSKRK